jgi:AcrR family transcriptional regulator
MSLSSTESRPATEQQILDAAARRVEAVGLTRTTLTDVAKAAGLSRMTIYRRYGSVEEIMQDLMTREFNALVLTLPHELAAVTRGQIVEQIVTTADALSSHPLFLRILAADPQLLLPYVTVRDGQFQRHAAEVLTSVLKAAIAAGEVRNDDPERLAASILLALRGFTLTDKSNWSGPRRRRMLDDISRMLDALLAPEDSP